MSEARDRVYSIAAQHAANWADGPDDDYCGIETGSIDDDRLHKALNTVETDALHRAAMRLADMHMDAVLTHGAGVGQGLVLAIKEIDPYERITTSPGTPELRFDECTEFCQGDEHWHRKEAQ